MTLQLDLGNKNQKKKTTKRNLYWPITSKDYQMDYQKGEIKITKINFKRKRRNLGYPNGYYPIEFSESSNQEEEEDVLIKDKLFDEDQQEDNLFEMFENEFTESKKFL